MVPTQGIKLLSVVVTRLCKFSGGKKSRGAKMQVLRKQLEETKARQVEEEYRQGTRKGAVGLCLA
jgi:hypothetical protein